MRLTSERLHSAPWRTHKRAAIRPFGSVVRTVHISSRTALGVCSSVWMTRAKLCISRVSGLMVHRSSLFTSLPLLFITWRIPLSWSSGAVQSIQGSQSLPTTLIEITAALKTSSIPITIEADSSQYGGTARTPFFSADGCRICPYYTNCHVGRVAPLDLALRIIIHCMSPKEQYVHEIQLKSFSTRTCSFHNLLGLHRLPHLRLLCQL